MEANLMTKKNKLLILVLAVILLVTKRRMNVTE